MSEDKTEGREVSPSVNPEERSNLEDYKSKDKASNTSRTTDFDSVTTVPTPEGDVQVETKLEIPVEDNKEDVKSEAKSPKVKKSSEEPSITTVSKEELSQRSKKEEHENKNKIISSKMSKFGKGFKIPDDK
jgi:hypothetical protein